MIFSAKKKFYKQLFHFFSVNGKRKLIIVLYKKLKIFWKDGNWKLNVSLLMTFRKSNSTSLFLPTFHDITLYFILWNFYRKYYMLFII